MAQSIELSSFMEKVNKLIQLENALNWVNEKMRQTDWLLTEAKEIFSGKFKYTSESVNELAGTIEELTIKKGKLFNFRSELEILIQKEQKNII